MLTTPGDSQVKQARNLPIMDTTKSDPYIVLTIGDTSKRTSVKRGQLNPVPPAPTTALSPPPCPVPRAALLAVNPPPAAEMERDAGLRDEGVQDPAAAGPIFHYLARFSEGRVGM